MSFKDFKQSLQACSSSRFFASSSLHPIKPDDRKPPKSCLRQQIALIERLAANLDCTPSGEALPSQRFQTVAVAAASLQLSQVDAARQRSQPFDVSLSKLERSSPCHGDACVGDVTLNSDYLGSFPKRRKLVSDPSGHDSQMQCLNTDGIEIVDINGASVSKTNFSKTPTFKEASATRGYKSSTSNGDYSLDAGKENASGSLSQRGQVTFGGLRNGSSPKRTVPTFVANTKTRKSGCKDLDSELDEDDQATGLGDSEAGLFIQSEREGLFEPLVLWPPDGEGSNGGLKSTNRVEVPASINSRLLEHQREGVQFLYNLYRENRGGVLGDDMGLGKTIQTIAFLSAILGKNDFDHGASGDIKQTLMLNPVLIISPTSVLKNWEQEFQAWGTFKIAIYHGIQRELVISRLASKELEVILTSFDTFRIHGNYLCDINWECVIIDEAHRLKNEKSQLFKVCTKILTKRRYGLTGTIMQNKLMDLFNVFDLVAPRCLGTREHFREFYEEPLKQGQRTSAPERFVCIAEKRKLHLSKVLQKHLLRRTKQETIGHMMMGKEDNVVFCAMSSLQQRVYRRLLESPDFQCLIKKDLPCSCGSPLIQAECCYRTVSNGIIWSYLHRENPDGCDSCPFCLVLPCLTKLQQVSNHLELIKPNAKDDHDKQKKDEALATAVLGEDAGLIGGTAQDASFLGLSDAQHCGKMRALELLLAHWSAQGDKVLLFSYSVRMLDILEKFLIRKGYCFSRLDGSTLLSNRQSIVDDFNNSPSKQVFLISTRAGGLGLNLVSANRVVIFDPNWNPAQDLQAQDRSFRYGQRRHVTVFRLLAAGSLEELVYSRQIYKQQLFNIAVSGNQEKRYFEGVQDSKENKGELFGISNLFRDLCDRVLTSEIIESHEDRLLSCHHTVVPSTAANEKSTLDRVDKISHILANAGVIYAHRNEDIVNSRVDVHKKKSICNTANKNVEQQKHNSSCKIGTIRLKEGTSHSALQCVTGGEKTRGPNTITKPIARKKAIAEASIVACKAHQFDQLAKFKGMDSVEFSKWLLSVSELERQQLLSDYKHWLETETVEA